MSKKKKLYVPKVFGCCPLNNEEFFLLVLVVVTYVSFSVVYILAPQSDSIWSEFEEKDNTENSQLNLLSSLDQLTALEAVTTEVNEAEESESQESSITTELKRPYLPAKNDSPFSANATAANINKPPEPNKDTKYIYLVNRDQHEVIPYSKFIDEEWFRLKCKFIKKCIVTKDINYLGQDAIDAFHALVFKVRFFNSDQAALEVLPTKRNFSQRYIMATHEAPRDDLQPPFINENYLSREFYNWTWTYRSDSDIIASYGYNLVKKKSPNPKRWSTRIINLNSKVNMQTKKKMVFWIVSHCTTVNYRENYVDVLQNFVDVDIYGSCNNKPCPRGTFDDCHKMEAMTHKFYIAFENSNCKDYITEKLWKALTLPIIPIVMGGGNYSQLAPPHSFIDVKDFPNVKALADYLKYLDSNDDKYLEYFKWKDVYDLYKYEPWCQLCEKLHDSSEPAKVYPDMSEWYSFDEHGNPLCNDGSDRNYFLSMFGADAKQNMLH